MKKLMTLFIFIFSHFLFAQNIVTRDYIKKNREMALEFSKEYSIPVEIILGIAIIESGSGQSKIVRNLNNHFGIVGSNKVKYRTRYKQYSNDRDSYKDFCNLISSKKFYAKLKTIKNYNLWVQNIAKIGYSENPKVWKKSLIKTIKTYKLDGIESEKIK